LKTHEIFKTAVRDNAIRITCLFSWFRHGKISVGNFENCCQPATAHTNKNLEKFCKVITKDWQSSILEIADGFSRSYGSHLQIVREDFKTGGRSLLRLYLYYLQMNRSRSRFGCQNMVMVPKRSSLIFAPCDFFMFLRMKSQLEAGHFLMFLKFRNNWWLYYVCSLCNSGSGTNAGSIA